MTFTETGHERLPEFDEPRVGEVVVLRHELRRDDLGCTYYHRDVVVGDESQPTTREQYRKMGDQEEARLRDNPGWRTTIANGGKIQVFPENEAAMHLYHDVTKPGDVPKDTQMAAWAEAFPSAIALEPLQRLALGGSELPGGTVDPRTLEWFTNMVDGIGIRSRARIYANDVVEVAANSPSHVLTIVSAGSGAAVPNIEASERVEGELGKRLNWKLYDLDPKALDFAEKLKEQSSVAHSTFELGERDNEGKFRGRNYFRAFEVPDGSADVVDALGLWEYLDDRKATKFLEKLYPKVKPGGKMIVSNMLTSRPQLEYNQRAVGWPSLHLRSDQELLDIVQAAGIDTHFVTMTHARDGVYVVMEIDMPS